MLNKKTVQLLPATVPPNVPVETGTRHGGLPPHSSLFYKVKHWGAIVLVFVMNGCYTPSGSSGVEILPASFKTIAIPTFQNNTPYYGVNEDLTKVVIDKFIQNGRLTVTDEKNADCLLNGDIVMYWIEPLSYNKNDIVEQKQLKMIVNLKFSDVKNNNKELWKEEWRQTEAGTEIGGIVDIVRFFVSGNEDSSNVIETEQDARERIIMEISEEIVKRTIYGW